MYRLIRLVLFRFDPEKIHYFTTGFLKILYAIPLVNNLLKWSGSVEDKLLTTKVAGMEFPNPVGLAAGFDKNADFYHELAHLGFGFIEVGTVTPQPQAGNPKPRLFRLRSDEAIINRMGFNNNGLQAAISNLKKRNTSIPIGGNIGKNKWTENENATEDYIQCFEGLFDFVDYFVVNVSSPNTPNLRDLQEKEPLKLLLTELQNRNEKHPVAKPLFLKIAPDLTDSQLDDVIEIVRETKISGAIATNTTINRSNLFTPAAELTHIGAGGLSGKPLKNRSTDVIRYLATKSEKSFAIIGVGGIHSAEDALEKLEAGADLVQLYTGFIYEGPALIKSINQAILKKRKTNASV